MHRNARIQRGMMLWLLCVPSRFYLFTFYIQIYNSQHNPSSQGAQSRARQAIPNSQEVPPRISPAVCRSSQGRELQAPLQYPRAPRTGGRRAAQEGEPCRGSRRWRRRAHRRQFERCQQGPGRSRLQLHQGAADGPAELCRDRPQPAGQSHRIRHAGLPQPDRLLSRSGPGPELPLPPGSRDGSQGRRKDPPGHRRWIRHVRVPSQLPC